MIEDILYENSAVNMYSMIGGGGGNFGGSNFGGGRGPKLSSLSGFGISDFGLRSREEEKTPIMKMLERSQKETAAGSGGTPNA